MTDKTVVEQAAAVIRDYFSDPLEDSPAARAVVECVSLHAGMVAEMLQDAGLLASECVHEWQQYKGFKEIKHCPKCGAGQIAKHIGDDNE